MSMSRSCSWLSWYVWAPGAQYLISVPDPVGEHFQKSITPQSYYQPPNHIRIFSRERFTELVENAGLLIEKHQSSSFFWYTGMIFSGLANVPEVTVWRSSRCLISSCPRVRALVAVQLFALRTCAPMHCPRRAVGNAECRTFIPSLGANIFCVVHGPVLPH